MLLHCMIRELRNLEDELKVFVLTARRFCCVLSTLLLCEGSRALMFLHGVMHIAFCECILPRLLLPSHTFESLWDRQTTGFHNDDPLQYITTISIHPPPSISLSSQFDCDYYKLQSRMLVIRVSNSDLRLPTSDSSLAKSSSEDTSGFGQASLTSWAEKSGNRSLSHKIALFKREISYLSCESQYRDLPLCHHHGFEHCYSLSSRTIHGCSFVRSRKQSWMHLYFCYGGPCILLLER